MLALVRVVVTSTGYPAPVDAITQPAVTATQLCVDVNASVDDENSCCHLAEFVKSKKRLTNGGCGIGDRVKDITDDPAVIHDQG
jgi:hypothetical protein